jgi:hypothetical protein
MSTLEQHCGLLWSGCKEVPKPMRRLEILVHTIMHVSPLLLLLTHRTVFVYVLWPALRKGFKPTHGFLLL